VGGGGENDIVCTCTCRCLPRMDLADTIPHVLVSFVCSKWTMKCRRAVHMMFISCYCFAVGASV
jgi:hypothetical protein